ncbi:MAG: endolytic transglycosylase MltG [Bacteroidales bacterium]|nr:endolytic transglycosylase MltG [Bacteroidales bacterium]
MNKKRGFKRALIAIGVVLLALGAASGGVALRYYYTFHHPNIGPLEEPVVIYVPTHATFDTLLDSLDAQHFLLKRNSFIRAANKEQLPERVKGGRYELTSGMNNKAIVRTFALGLQSPVNLVISGNIRSVERLSAVLTRNIEADSLSMLLVLTNEEFIRPMGFDSTSLFCLFLPNTYQVYWTTPAEKIIERLYKEYNTFWSEERRNKAASIGLSLHQVSTLASIVYEETRYQPEMATVAGVYMNRLRIRMPLQADPTLIFSLRESTPIRRVLSRDRKVDSPYNTYMHRGLPPGPICVPSIATLEAVLNYETHNYLYFCAKSDFSGSHIFTTNYNDHLRNARAYHRALNERGIMR